MISYLRNFVHLVAKNLWYKTIMEYCSKVGSNVGGQHVADTQCTELY